MHRHGEHRLVTAIQHMIQHQSDVDRQRLLQRFLSYVQVDTTAVAGLQQYPSSAGQIDLGKQLCLELRDAGIPNVTQDEHGIVLATIPANVAHTTPIIAFNSHLDTSPETTGKDVRPQVIEEYQGGSIVLPGDRRRVITVDENPELNNLHGCSLITTDGTTLLGGDDKAGIAEIMEAAIYLVEHPEIKHGPIRLLFTCDEEIGHGIDYVDVAGLGASACYTLDGGGAGNIDVETFSADVATIIFEGINIHPSIAKGRMVNAVRAAGEFLARLPRDRMAPESTAGRDGFIHPYDIQGGVANTSLQLILRDFDLDGLKTQAQLLRDTAEDVQRELDGIKISVETTKQYRNMREGLSQEPRAVEFAEEAHRRLGYPCQKTIVRGGTDGSQLTEKGLPTPNLSSGQHNPHSPLEWACLDEMVQAVDVLVQLAQIWGEQQPA